MSRHAALMDCFASLAMTEPIFQSRDYRLIDVDASVIIEL